MVRRWCGRRHAQGGFTLLEVLVTLVIVGILLALTTRGLPLLRQHQQLMVAIQQIQSVVREAQQRAFNETREPLCVSDARASEPNVCSDVGLSFVGSALTMYADLDQTGSFSAAGDYVIQQQQLPAGVTSTVANELVFVGSPPELELKVDGVALPQGQVTLQVRQLTTTVQISRYGHVARVPY